jgi:hypothetical protein
MSVKFIAIVVDAAWYMPRSPIDRFVGEGLTPKRMRFLPEIEWNLIFNSLFLVMAS